MRERKKKKSDSRRVETEVGRDKKESASHSPSFWLVTRVWPYGAQGRRPFLYDGPLLFILYLRLPLHPLTEALDKNFSVSRIHRVVTFARSRYVYVFLKIVGRERRFSGKRKEKNKKKEEK